MMVKAPLRTLAVLLITALLALPLASVPAQAFSGIGITAGCESWGWHDTTPTPKPSPTPPPTPTPTPTPVPTPTPTPESYNLYFGQLHSHTSLSDGTGTLDEAYSYARDTAKLDFLAITDNSEAFDSAAQANLLNGTASYEWMAGQYAALRYTSSSFLGLYGYEMALDSGNGHLSTFNTLGFENRDKAKYQGSQGLAAYYGDLKNYAESISQFNHPGSAYGSFQDFAYLDPQIDSAVSLIEVGSGEGAVGATGYSRSYSLYDRALDKGWHLAPTNNQDNRKGLWGSANTARTVVLAKNLTKNDLMDALKKMRVYATEDKNLRIQYTLNSLAMGSRLAQKPAKVNIRAVLEEKDGESIGRVSVIVNGGKVLTSQTLAVSRYVLELTLEPDYSYYYLKVEQLDGDIAVTAPVFLDSNRAGIAKTYASTAQPQAGVALKITSELFNHELVPMPVTSLVYSVDGNVVKSVTTQDSIGALQKTAYSFDYTPPRAGTIKIDVKLVAVVNGVSKTFTDSLTLVVNNPPNPSPTPTPSPTPSPAQTDKDAANKVVQLIKAIHQPAGKPQKDEVGAARKAYDQLTKPQKQLVGNYWQLVAAENRLAWFEMMGKHKGQYKKAWKKWK